MTRRSFFGWFASILAITGTQMPASTKLKRHGWQLQPKSCPNERDHRYILLIGTSGSLALHLSRVGSIPSDPPYLREELATLCWSVQLRGSYGLACSACLPVSGPDDAQKRAEAIAVEWGVETAVDSATGRGAAYGVKP